MIDYCLQGIELFQKLYIGLEYMVSKATGNSSEINKVVQKCCKFSQKVKVVSTMSKKLKVKAF